MPIGASCSGPNFAAPARLFFFLLLCLSLGEPTRDAAAEARAAWRPRSAAPSKDHWPREDSPPLRAARAIRFVERVAYEEPLIIDAQQKGPRLRAPTNRGKARIEGLIVHDDDSSKLLVAQLPGGLNRPFGDEAPPLEEQLEQEILTPYGEDLPEDEPEDPFDVDAELGIQPEPEPELEPEPEFEPEPEREPELDAFDLLDRPQDATELLEQPEDVPDELDILRELESELEAPPRDLREQQSPGDIDAPGGLDALQVPPESRPERMPLLSPRDLEDFPRAGLELTPEEERRATEALCSEELAELKASTLADIELDITVEGSAGIDFPFECPLEQGAIFRERGWPCVTYNWTASALRHYPLYFEDVQLERYGHSWGPCLQPVVSGVHFFSRLPVLPYCMGYKPPRECVYTLGHYRPNSCAPYLIPAVPISLRGGMIQAGAVVGAAAILP